MSQTLDTTAPAGRPVPTTLAEFAACPENDLEIVAAWTGPAIDEATGRLREPLRTPHVIATSSGWPRPGCEEAAIELNEAILKELYVRDGLLAVTLAISQECWGSTRSLSIWRDEAALEGFVRCAPHMKAVRRTQELMFQWQGTQWESHETVELPTFADARARLAAVRSPEN
jgi:quinol monooxygenase YgiN